MAFWMHVRLLKPGVILLHTGHKSHSQDLTSPWRYLTMERGGGGGVEKIIKAHLPVMVPKYRDKGQKSINVHL